MRSPYRFWTDPERIAEHRLPARASFLPAGDAQAAPTAAVGERVLRLDGTWRFHLADRPEATPDDFADPDLDDSGWSEIAVPGVWTMQGFDQPIYTNHQMPFPHQPPQVPEDNPTGCYRCAFTLPAAWDGLGVHLHLAGVDGVVRVFCNGAEVGLSTDSRLPAEFDLGPFLTPGRNLLALQVVRWSAQSFVEDQDHWWHAGIHREVLLLARPPAWLADLAVRPRLDDDGTTGHLAIEARIGGAVGDEGHQLRIQLHDAEGRPRWRKPWLLTYGGPLPGEGGHGPIMPGERRVGRVKPWSAESPARYQVVAELLDADGAVLEAAALTIGFRTIALADRALLVNGQAVEICGVNRHDHHPTNGKTVSRERMRAELALMKRHNFNAVRTAHYPNHPDLLDLCDELGLYVVDEANLESHHRMHQLCDDPTYAATFLARVQRMVLRDLHHPCVIAWSLGNESGYGPNHDAAAGWVRHYDASRPLHYEGAIWARRSLYESPWQANPGTDLLCPMYPHIDHLREWVEDGSDRRPLVMCEYSHAMGNSNGGLKEYWDLIWERRGVQGGFIWDWIDQGLEQRTADGRIFWAYGGDFGETVHDHDFCINGLIWPDLEPHPAMAEAAWCQQPVTAAPATGKRGRPRPDRVVITNRRHFTDLADLVGLWRVTIDGETAAEGHLPRLETPPGASEAVALELPKLRREPGQEAHLTVTFALRRATAWAPAGHRVAGDQWPLAVPVRGRAPTVVAGPGSVAVDRKRGVPVLLDEHGNALLAAPPSLSLWRPPTDNDGPKHRLGGDPPPRGRKPLFRWVGLGLHHLAEEGRTVRPGRNRTVVRSSWHPLGSESRVEVASTYREADGGLWCEHELRLPRDLADPPRLGFDLTLAAGFEALEWFGPGPHETYPDRCAGATIGRWGSTVSDQYVPYIEPQEHGHHHACRWFAVRRDDGLGILVTAATSFGFSARHHHPDDLAEARHGHELAARAETFLALDAAHRGLGSGSCGPDTWEAYLIPAGRHRLAWHLRLLAADEDPAPLAAAIRASAAC